MIEFDDQDMPVFDQIMRALELHPAFDRLKLSNESTVTLHGLEINADRRKVYWKQQEIKLTTKEYELLCLLVANKGIVLTYEQIYLKIWGEDGLDNERNAVGCHVRNLRKKLYMATPDDLFSIRCVREIGYCLEVNESKLASR